MSSPLKKPIALLGAGSFGTALAITLGRNEQPVLLWGRASDAVFHLQQHGANRQYLADISLPSSVTVTTDLAGVLEVADDLLLVVPSDAFRDTVEQIAPSLRPESRIAWATKGLDPASGRLLSTVIEQVCGATVPMAVLSGPSFAREVALGQPTAVVIAANQAEFSRDLVARFHSQVFRVYTSQDMIGVQLGGVVKNVIAIATGIAAGLGYGENTRAALITRGLAELVVIGQALSAQHDTCFGLAGVGDLVLTCSAMQSRNYRCGYDLGRGQGLAQTLADIQQVVEGVQNAKQLYELAAMLQVDMPICEAVYQIIAGELSPAAAADALLARHPTTE